MNNLIPIVYGEPRSINCEIIAKTWKKLKLKKKKRIFLIGNYNIIQNQIRKHKINLKLLKISKLSDFTQYKKKSNTIKVLDIPNNDKLVINSINKAHNLAEKKKIKGFVTAPINKKILNNKFPGLTEYLAHKCNLNGSEVMMIFNKKLAVVPLTTHLEIKNVTKKITKSLILKKTKTLNNFYKKYFLKKPRIAMLGLNPHNSENKKNSTENLVIKQSIKKLKKERINVEGPFPADTIFMKNKFNFDVIVGMYHDQVLTPFKTLFKFNASNITLGLNYVRISPDHGTGQDIIGKNKANPESLIYSLNTIFKLVK